MLSRVAVFLALLCSLLAAAPAYAAEIVGIEFVETPFYSPLLSLYQTNNVVPFQFTDPSNNFSISGALDGYSEDDVRNAIVATIQTAFRRAEISQPGRMLNIDIRMGVVEPSVGTVHSIGEYIFPTNLLGSAYPTGAVTRPDLEPDSVYTNQLSVTLASTVNRLPEFEPGLTFDTLDQVVYSIAGTASHEIAHTLNVWNHVEASQPIRGFFPLMGSGASGLPIPERLRERRFLDVPNTQYENPHPPPGGPITLSVTDTLLNAAGTTFVSDFNFDGFVDVQDFSIWNANKFRTGTNVKTGDANDDGVTDVSDFVWWNSQRGQSAALHSYELDPESDYELDLDAGWLGLTALSDTPKARDAGITEIESVNIGLTDGSARKLDVVPEPQGVLVVLAGLAGLAMSRKR